MYKCLECGKTFETPITWYERHGLDTPPYEKWTGCPYCKGGYEEIEEEEGEEDE